MALSAARVQQILSWSGRIKNTVPDPPPTDTEVRLELDQTLLKGKPKAG